MKRVIALACADEPLARKAFFPAHAPLGADADVVLEEPLVAESELLSLPQPASMRATAASTLMAAPERLSFT